MELCLYGWAPQWCTDTSSVAIHTTPRDWENLGDLECKIHLLPYENKCWSSVYYHFDLGGWLDSKATEEGQLELGVSLCCFTDASLAELKEEALWCDRIHLHGISYAKPAW